MATKIAPTLRASLERLKHGGAVNGLCLGWRRQVLVNLLPYEDHRADRLIHELHDAREHFSSGGRHIQTFWFGYEGVHALAVYRDDCVLAILHSRTADVDFLAKAAASFLEDASLLIHSILQPSENAISEADTQELIDHEQVPLSSPTHLIGRELI